MYLRHSFKKYLHPLRPKVISRDLHSVLNSVAFKNLDLEPMRSTIKDIIVIFRMHCYCIHTYVVINKCMDLLIYILLTSFSEFFEYFFKLPLHAVARLTLEENDEEFLLEQIQNFTFFAHSYAKINRRLSFSSINDPSMSV